MANAIITPTIIAKEALMQLKNSTVLGNLSHREYKNEFGKKIGSTVNLRKPVKFVASDGATRVNQDVEEAETPLTINKQKHVSWEFSSQELTLSIEEYSERYIKPASIALSNKLDSDGFALYPKFWNQVGTPGTTPNTFATVSPAAQRMTEMSVPEDNRNLVLNPAAKYAIAGDQVGLYNGNKVKTAYEKANIGDIADLSVYSSNNIKTHTTGTFTTGSTPLVNGGSQNTTYALSKTTNSQSLVTDGWANSTAIFKAGDVFTLNGVHAVNPVPTEGSKTTLPYLQQFTVLSDVSSDGSGNATLTISPAIITSGPYQTVSAAPADNAVITPMGTEGTAYPINMAFHKNALALVTCPLVMPDDVVFKAQENYDGLSIRVIKQYDIDADKEVIRLDILYGWDAIYADLGTRLIG